MNRNILCFWMGAMLCSAMPICAQQSTSEKVSDKSKKDYRIEVDKDQNDVPQKIRFVSPDKKTIKTLPADKVIVSKSGRNLISQDITKTEPGSEYEEYERELIDASGKVRWHKKWKNYPQYGANPEDGYSGWFEGISDNGERSFVTYRDADGKYYLVVLDEAGKETTKIWNNEMLTGVEISPDGRLAHAIVHVSINGKAVKHLLFLDTTTKTTKLMAAEMRDVSVRAYVLDGKLVQFWIGNNLDHNRNKVVTLKFSQIPTDVSVIITGKSEGNKNP